MRWQLHRSAQGVGKSTHALKSRFIELNKVRFSVAHRTHVSIGEDQKSSDTSPHQGSGSDDAKPVPPWRGYRRHSSGGASQRSASILHQTRKGPASIRGVEVRGSTPSTARTNAERMFVYDLGKNGVAQGPAATHASGMHGRLRGSSVVVTMVEAAIIHFQVSTMEKCFFALCDWVDRRQWERAAVEYFNTRTALRLLPQALVGWRNAFRCQRYYYLRTTSKSLEAWRDFTHEAQQAHKLESIATIYHDLRTKVRSLHMWREASAAATVERYQCSRADALFRGNMLRLGLRAFQSAVANNNVDYLLEDRAMRHYVRGLAARVIGEWQSLVHMARTETLFAGLGRLRALARRFAQLRFGVEISKDERVQARHSDVYRRIFLLSRSFQMWQRFVHEMRRCHWADGVNRISRLKEFIVEWRVAKDALVARRHRREASDMLFEHRAKRRFFFLWNASIHERYMVRAALAISNVLDSKWAVRRWRDWAAATNKSRSDRAKGKKLFLRRQLRRWRKETMHRLADVRAQRHFVKQRKRKGIERLLGFAQTRIHLRRLTIEAWAHSEETLKKRYLEYWVGFIRRQQEMRGKMNMADAHHRSVVLRHAFDKVGLPIFMYKGKEVRALSLYEEHRQRRVRVSVASIVLDCLRICFWGLFEC
jgi:hypothetical protein